MNSTPTMKYLLITTCCVVSQGLAVPAAAQGLFEQAVSGESEEEPATEDDSAGKDFFKSSALEFNGYLRGDLFLGKVMDEDVTEIKTAFAEVAGKLRARAGDWGSGFGELRLRYGSDGTATGLDYDLREAYVELFLGPVDLRVGHQIIAWGRADGFNPTNNLTPQDMSIRSADEDDVRLGNFALRSTLNLEPTRLELVWVPVYAPARFPDFSLPGPIGFADPEYPDADFEHGIYAARLNVELSFIDFSVSYLFGYSTFPGLELAELMMDPTDVESSGVSVRFRAYQQHVAGLDFAASVSDWFGIRGEAALRWPEEYEDLAHVPRPDLQWVLGVDREFGDLSIIAQYIGRYVVDFEAGVETPLLGYVDRLAAGGLTALSPDEQIDLVMNGETYAHQEVRAKALMIAGQTEEHQHSLMARVAYKFLQETLTLELMGLYNISSEEYLLRPKLTYALTDGLNFIAGGQIFGGPDGTLYGMVDEIQSAGYVEIKAYF